MTIKRPEPSRIRVRPGDGPPPSVDGHPGWVASDNAAWSWAAGLAIAATGLLTGTGPVLTQTRSAAWWVILSGALLGALLLWLPLHGMMRAPDGRALTYDEALRAAFGSMAGTLISLLLCASALTDAALMLRCLSSIVPLYLLEGATDVNVMLSAALALLLMLRRSRARGFSRAAWALRFVLGALLLISCLLMTENARLHNLFPMLGNSAQETLLAFPTALGSGAAVVLLGLAPRFTGSAKPPRFVTGLSAALTGSLICGALTLLSNLSVPPAQIENAAPGGIRLMLGIEYLRRAEFYRMFYHFALLLLFLLAAGALLAGGTGFLQGAWRLKKHKPAALVCCAVCASLAFCPDDRFFSALWTLHGGRAVLLIVPAWLGWIVLALKRRKEASRRETR